MEELHDIAEAYFTAGSDDLKQLATEFFEAMDYDNNDRITLHEYLAFMRKEGYTARDGRDTLGFSEVLTLFYIINSGRPISDGCSDLVKGIFFSCLKCFDSNAFNVCPKCYRHGKYAHSCSHGQFMDNFTLLQLKKNAFSSQVAACAHTVSTPTTSNYVQVIANSESEPSSPPSHAIVPAANGRRKYNWRDALKIAGAGINVASIVSNGCSIL